MSVTAFDQIEFQIQQIIARARADPSVASWVEQSPIVAMQSYGVDVPYNPSVVPAEDDVLGALFAQAITADAADTGDSSIQCGLCKITIGVLLAAVLAQATGTLAALAAAYREGELALQLWNLAKSVGATIKTIDVIFSSVLGKASKLSDFIANFIEKICELLAICVA